MADQTSPNANSGKSYEFLPKFFQSDANKKFLQATVDQLTQNGTVKKVNGYIGRQNARATSGNDVFISAPSKARQDYQLEPGLIIDDELGNNSFFKDYQDYINQLSVFGSPTANHPRLNKQELYSWDPHISWDKFVNFQNYYWLPYGPDTIAIKGQQNSIVSEYNIFIESEGDNNVYIFAPNVLVRNPTIKLYRGQTYKFTVNSPGNPFSIKTRRTPGKQDIYVTSDIDQQSVETGTITFTVPYSSPDILFYMSESDSDLGGVFEVASIDENTSIDVSTDILGKVNYTLPDGTELSNGMKVRFIGNVLPEQYASGFYYVEGVGSSIQLVNETILEIISSYTSDTQVQFDSVPFDSMPWSEATSFAGTKDYIVINRASDDHNPWSRINRWFHKDVIEASAKYNGQVPSIDQNSRAVRPIIEFDAGLKLFNFGHAAIADVDLVDTYTKDVFSNIEGQLGYNVDGIALSENQRVLFAADTDIRVKNNIYRVTFSTINGVRQIHLVLESTPAEGNVILVKQGVTSQGTMYWFNGTAWALGQQKKTLNQPPLFDIFDDSGYSFSDADIYNGSTFKGTKLFSYKVGSGTVDANLGFALSYKNINNVGDIVFNFDILSDSFQYKNIVDVITTKTNIGYLKKYNTTSAFKYVNGWQTCNAATTQPAIRIYKNSNKVNNFDLDIYDNVTDLIDLTVRVYVNGIRLENTKWNLVDGIVYKKIVLDTDITVDDVLTIKSFAKQSINSKGYYEIPVNLQNNPLNDELSTFTLGEVGDHVLSIVENLNSFTGSYPGVGNLRDLGNVTQYGTKFVQHSGPISLSLYHITSESNNVIRAIEYARDEYGRFKRNFISVAETLGVDTDTITQVDLILEKINKDKPKTASFYFSDTVPFGANIKTTLSVIDYRIKTYPLTTTFSLDTLSTKAVGVYHNDNQLLAKRQYTFSDQGFVVIDNSVALKNGDSITIIEYDNTNGCYVPQTPTKLGIWPKYEPMIYVDTSLITPRTLIQGHDGSQILAYGDYRDDLILELEKRIYNNIKVEYDNTIFDIDDVVPSYNRSTDYSLDEFNQTLAPSFYKWLTLVDRDFTKPLGYDRNNPLTFNYKGHAAPDGRSTPGYWRGVYRWLLGTDRPNIAPWEMLGISQEPSWWQEVYGPAPYTKDNVPMWTDLSTGTVRQPGVPAVVLSKYIRPYLVDHIPVDESGNIVSPLISGLSQGIITTSTGGDFVFGDVSPIEAAWRRSSYYPFSVLITAMLLQPAKTFGTLLDRSRIVRNVAGQLVYSETGLRIRPQSIVLPSIYSSTTDIQTSGIINYIVDYILSDNLKSYNSYKYDLEHITAKLSYRVGAFTSKEKFNLLLDSKTPLSQGSVFVPQEDYSIILNTSSPVKKITYSAVIVTKMSDGYSVKGYSLSEPFFKYYPWIQSGIAINVGGISESYSVWTSNSQYAAGKIVEYGGKYFRSNALHTTTSTFDQTKYQILPSLPIIGGRNATLRKSWNRSEPIVVPYGTKFSSTQEVVDFLLGYGEYLKDQGFEFDQFNNTLNAVSNWETSAKEFMFWTTQNWSSGEDKWTNWIPNTDVQFGEIVKYNGDYYRALRNSPADIVFVEEDFVKLDGLSTVGSSVISLSPSATNITFSTPYCVVDDISNSFNAYEIFKVDGTPLSTNFLNSYRQDNAVSYSPRGEEGIFGASFYLIQQEQVVVINNTTMFNDTIYNLSSGYRQERIKVAGYISADWYGGFDVPGFIFDQAAIKNWEAWQDYALGDIVKYKEFYYSAQTFLPGTYSFEPSNWVKLSKKPTQELLPNWTYKAGQFMDFYSLDSDNFDSTQQQLAQHLVGYQKRQYLSNIIKDDVSEFKFYQGMIAEKGTQNVLNKLFDVLSASDQSSLSFYEEWALRTGQYGSNEAFENIEFKLDESLFKTNPQGVELVTTNNTSLIDFIIRQTHNDVYLKPLGYNTNPWPLISNFKPYLRTPGYVRSEDVTVTLNSLSDILTQDISMFSEGSYVWCAFDVPPDFWNVYRFTNAGFSVSAMVYSAGAKTLLVTVNGDIPFVTGDYVGIQGVATFSGFYQVTDVAPGAFTLSATIANWSEPFAEFDTVAISRFTKQRTGSIDTASQVLPKALKENELLWTDKNSQGKWTVWQHANAYTKTEITNSLPINDLQYGKAIVVNTAGNIAAITNNLGDVIIHDKASPVSPWIQRQSIIPPYIATTGTPNSVTGGVIAMSSDSTWLATGAPLASNANTVTTAFLNVADITGTPSGLTNQGAISIYKKDVNNIFTLVDTILSPVPADNEQFGTSIVFGNNTVFVSASGTDTVYSLSYATSTQATASYNPFGSSDYTMKVSTVTGTIVEGMAVVGTGFTSNQTVVQVIDASTILLSSPPDSAPQGIIQFTVTQWQYDNSVITPTGGDTGFGSKMTASNDGLTLLITASTPGNVSVYKNILGSWTFIQKLTGLASAASSDGSVIAIADQRVNTNTGNVKIYSYSSTTFDYGSTPIQTILALYPVTDTYFGADVKFMNDSETLVVFTNSGYGGLTIYDRYETKWIFGEMLWNPSLVDDGFGTSLSVGSNIIFVGAPHAIDQSIDSGRVYDFIKSPGTASWSVLHSQIDKPDVSKIKQAFLYNTKTNKLITYLDVLDSTQGRIPGIADAELKYKTYYDPAIYSVGNSAVNVDDGMAWAADRVGMLWWDLRTAKFIDSSDNDVVYRNSTWNTLFPSASIDVYEWVSSTLLPAAWNAIADTEEGLAIGVSGTTMYDNTVYSVVKRYDSVAKTFKNTYFYWVKNKATIPNVPNRAYSAKDVAALIENPRGQGYKYLALTSSNSFSLVNVKPLLQDTDVALSVEYWTVENKNKNIHTQWKLLSNDVDSDIPNSIEQKWVDSLCGKDAAGRVVPDPELPIKLRYGIENRPRQGMFVNRFEGLKQVIEQVNRVLVSEQISESADLTLLNEYDSPPNILLGEYDSTFDTDAELRFATISTFVKPVVGLVAGTDIVDGKIVSVTITEKGSGYIVAPYIEVVGTGVGAKIRAVINARGQITGVNILDAGQGYGDTTILVVRNYSVLVNSDSQANNSWSIYAYEPSTQVWSRVQSQTYDTRRYWSYVDWYATGYNQFTAVDYAVNTLSELNSLSIQVGQNVKVLTNNSGNWTMLHKYAESNSIDWTQSYQTVGLQNGTIQFSPSLYMFKGSAYGYDGSLYDGSIFDNSASIELRNILSAIKNNIFIDNLKIEYLNMFFTSIRYALSEQSYIDWAFKTSFVKVHHNVGELRQKVTYNNDNLTDFESYVNEVKPYRTKVREYISNYSNLDTGKMSVTDFDVPPVYENGKLSVMDINVDNTGTIVASSNAIQSYPWKHWYDNVGFIVTDIKIVSSGSGYISEPVVRFVGSNGSNASARAFISNGKVSRIVILTNGSGFLSAPTIILDGGLSSTGTQARAVAYIGNSVVRSTLVKMKFDRITKNYVLSSLQHNEVKTGSGSRLQFSLVWGPDVRIGTSSVTINGVAALRDDYTLSIVKSTTKGYTSYSGSITFDVAPASGATIDIKYTVDWSLLSAADRIQFYYNPSTGELGKDLAQLMSGVDYGGVIVSGMGFEVAGGWGDLPYYVDKWASVDETFDDVTQQVTPATAASHTFALGYTPDLDTELNVYYSMLNIDGEADTDGVTTTYSVNPFGNAPLDVVATLTRTVTAVTNLGNTTITVNNAAGIKIGDEVIVSVATHSNGIVTAVNLQTNTITIDQIFYVAVPIGAIATFTRVLKSPTDYSINATGQLQLVTPLAIHSKLEIKSFLNVVRLDDPYFNTPDQKNPYAIMQPIIADGVLNSITFDSTMVAAFVNAFGSDVNVGDIITIRKSTSDGSVKPQDDDYDTALTGGTLVSLGGVYTTATGKTADEIILDGDGFVTPTTSPATEEVVPGQVVDAVSIKVYDRPTGGSASIVVDSFLGNGTDIAFELKQTPNSTDAIIVKTVEKVVGMDGTPSRQSTILDNGIDYTFDYATKTITTTNPVADGVTLSVFNIGFSGNNILDLDYFVANGVTTEFVTKAPWLDTVSHVVYVDGQPMNVELFKTDTSYDTVNRIGIRFITAPAAQSLITFIIVRGNQPTFAITKSEKLIGNFTNSYTLANTIGDSLPIESNMIVRVNQTILSAPNNSYFTIKNNKLTYAIDATKFLPYSVSSTDVAVLANGVLLSPLVDYVLDLGGISVKISKAAYKTYAGKSLVISIKQANSYHYVPSVPPELITSNVYTGTDEIEVISSYKHDVLDIQRTAVNITSNLVLTPSTSEYYSYRSLSSGLLPLDREVINDNYVWVVKNGTLLTPGIDFKLTQNRQSIELAFDPALNDEFTLMTFGTNVLTTGIAYMQFKDILNRVIFKRLSTNKQTVLTQALMQSDTHIYVADASKFDIPSPSNNKPGIVEIAGERIEYFTLVGNVLGQLRRGTLGTGVRELHNVGSIVQDIGISETLPYTEDTKVRNIISDGTTTVNIDFVPTSVNDIEVFAGGKRLKKTSYSVYGKLVNDTIVAPDYPDSPEGDITRPAEFSVTGTTNVITLRDAPVSGTRITVVQRNGKAWDSLINIQNDTNNIAQFLKAAPGIWYTDFKNT